MRQMKDSGVEWIGEIPVGWKVSTIKREYSFQTGWTPSTDNDGYFEGDNIWVNISDMKEKTIFDSQKHISDEAISVSSMNIAPKGSLMYAFKLSVGAVSFCGVDMYTNEAIATFLPGENLLGYLYYLAPIAIIKNANENIYGAKLLNQQLIRNAKIVLPPVDEQQRIADFLDAKCAKIDALIAKQQAVIEKLKAYKLSVIAEAVTKGLNPDAPMKDSGVEWIGNIPTHWYIHKFCWDYSAMLGKMLDAKRVTGKNMHPYIKNADVQWFSLKSENLDEMDFEENEKERYSVRPGDLMICEGGEIGKCAIIPDDFPEGIYYQKALHRVRRRTENSGNIEYLSYLMFCMAKNESFGTSPEKATIAHLPGDALSQLRLPAPPIKEQREISEYLNRKCQSLDKMLSKKQETIQKLLLYKKSLIYEVVTGKREV